MMKQVKSKTTKKQFQDTALHSEQLKLINTKLPATDEDKRIAVPFDVIHPLEILNHYYYMPEDVTTQEEKEYITQYVKMLSERLLVDLLELLTKSIEFLDATRIYKYSYDRCKVYYSIVLVAIELLNEIEGSTYVVFYRMFNIPFLPRKHGRSVPFEDYASLVPDTTGEHDEVKAEKNPKFRATMIKYPFVLENAWRSFMNKLIYIREDLEVGLRLSLQYTLAHYPFCNKSCCQLPEELKCDDM